MLIVFCEEDQNNWIDDDDCSKHHDLWREPSDELNLPIHPSVKKDRGQTQLLMCFKEKLFHQTEHQHNH